MAVFDFLHDANTERKVAGKVFNFLTRAVPGVAQQREMKKKVSESSGKLARLPRTAERDRLLEETRRLAGKPDAAEQTRDLVVGAARGVARTPETIGRSVLQGGVDLAKRVNPDIEVPNFDSAAPTDPLRRLAYGDEKVETYQTRRRGYEKALKEGTYTGADVIGGKDVARDLAAPLSFLGIGLTGALDVPGGAAKGGAKELLKKGSKQEATLADTTSSIGRAAAKPPDIAPPGGIPPGQRQRGFLHTVQEAENTTPELKQAAGEVEPQTYEVRHNQELFDKAKTLVDNNYSAALERVNAAPSAATYDDDVATGLQLMSKAQREGRTADAVELAEKLDEKGRQLGRGVQAFAGYKRLTPEGMLLFAQKEIRKAKENKGFVEKLFNKEDPELTPELAKGITDRMKVVENLPGGIAGDEAQLIKRSLEGGVGETPNVDHVVKESIKSAQEPKTVAEKVAKKVGTAISPAKKKAVDNLVNELSAKIKKDVLDLPKLKQADPIAVLKETLRRNTEAQEAWPEVKSILREKFADNEKALETLEKLFGADLKVPAASTGTVNRAIAAQLAKSETKISQVVTQSLSKQRDVVEDVTQALKAEGIDEATARAFAQDIAARLDTRLGETKAKILERMMQETPKHAQPTIIDKINKLSNLGALDNNDYLELARAKLNLPKLDEATAKQLSEISQKLQDNPNQAEALTRETLELINDQIPIGFSEKFDAYRYQNLLSNPRTQLRNITGNLFNTMITRPATLAARASTDWFAATLFGKQREFYLNEVPEYYRGMFNSFGDAAEAAKKAWKGEVEILNPDMQALRSLRTGRLPKKYTVVPRLMEAQDRFLMTLISTGEYAAQKAKGVADDVAKAEAEKVAKYSLFRNVTDPTNKTGQGDLLSKIDQFTEIITREGGKFPFFRWFVPFIKTPANISKQFLEYSPLGFATLKGSAHKTEQLSKAMAGTMLTVVGAKVAMDGNTTWDAPKDETERQLFYESGKRPYSIKIGDKWVPMIYLGPFALAFALPAAAKDANDDVPLDASTMERVAAAAQNSVKFFSQQTYVQGIANVVDLISGEGDANLANSLGFTAGQAIPLQGLWRYVAGIIDPTFRKAEGFTDSVQKDLPFLSKNLEPYTDLSGEESRRDVTDFTAPYTIGQPSGTEDDKATVKANSEFLRTLRRTSRMRTRANEQINDALAERDYERAQRIAQSYNDRLRETFRPVVKKYRPHLADSMADEYNSQKIRLTRASVSRRRLNMLNRDKEERNLVNR